MTVIADTGALYALYDRDDRHHLRIVAAVEGEPGPLVVPSLVLAELDYLLREYLGVDAEVDFLDSVIAGAFSLEPMTPEDLKRCRQLVAQYRDLDIGVVDASIVATAERLGVDRILTVDIRDFRAVTSKRGKHFYLLPWDLPDRCRA